jgi:hypothetical protein
VNLGLLMLKALGPLLPLIVATAKAEHVHPRTLAAIVYMESRGLPSTVGRERDGDCSVGLGQIKGSCDPERVARLQDPSVNLRVAARILRANESWCRKHVQERRCVAGERVFRGGGAVNLYAGNTNKHAKKVWKLRVALAGVWHKLYVVRP